MSAGRPRVGRDNDELRPVQIQASVARHAEGSASISFGETVIWCTASIEDRVPAFLEGKRQGWVTAEYAMLPRSTTTRISWDRSLNSGRSQEISRLIGRSLRAGVDLRRLGERTITIDCVVQQADGGTRTAAITGGFVALAMACRRLVVTRQLQASPITMPIAAVSVGIVGGDIRVDLDYGEDARAAVDCNVVMNAAGELIEIQGSAEGRPFTRAQTDQMLDVAGVAIQKLVGLQRSALDVDGGSTQPA
ncbi:MAG TPA: ribonuclease PH [Thermomicrobiales bacterium]|nr:ribonuclease PH [Thermomicrobiales bacterium]HRA31250.1 ribonuclease PH [Thermomicrobiales bacterium]